MILDIIINQRFLFVGRFWLWTIFFFEIGFAFVIVCEWTLSLRWDVTVHKLWWWKCDLLWKLEEVFIRGIRMEGFFNDLIYGCILFFFRRGESFSFWESVGDFGRRGVEYAVDVVRIAMSIFGCHVSRLGALDEVKIYQTINFQSFLIPLKILFYD